MRRLLFVLFYTGKSREASLKRRHVTRDLNLQPCKVPEGERQGNSRCKSPETKAHRAQLKSKNARMAWRGKRSERNRDQVTEGPPLQSGQDFCFQAVRKKQ